MPCCCRRELFPVSVALVRSFLFGAYGWLTAVEEVRISCPPSGFSLKYGMAACRRCSGDLVFAAQHYRYPYHQSRIPRFQEREVEERWQTLSHSSSSMAFISPKVVNFVQPWLHMLALRQFSAPNNPRRLLPAMFLQKRTRVLLTRAFIH